VRQPGCGLVHQASNSSNTQAKRSPDFSHTWPRWKVRSIPVLTGRTAENRLQWVTGPGHLAGLEGSGGRVLCSEPEGWTEGSRPQQEGHTASLLGLRS
jgi:hypothetical protein